MPQQRPSVTRDMVGRLSEAAEICITSNAAAGQSISGTSLANLTMDTDELDPGDWHDTVTDTHQITPDVAGWYHVTVWGGLTGLSSTDSMSLRVTKNGTEFAATVVPGTTTSTRMTVSGYIDLNGTTDYVTAQIFNGSATAKDTRAVRLTVELAYAT